MEGPEASETSSDNLISFIQQEGIPAGQSIPRDSQASVDFLVGLLREVYQDHLLYDLFQSQECDSDASSIAAICTRVSDVLHAFDPRLGARRHG